MGEAPHLSHSERIAVIKAARNALDDAGFTSMPIIAGTGAGSTRETIELTKEAAEAGADYAIVICSGYFAGALVNNKKALKAFWTEVAAKSPIPVIIYNCTLHLHPPSPAVRTLPRVPNAFPTPRLSFLPSASYKPLLAPTLTDHSRQILGRAGALTSTRT